MLSPWHWIILLIVLGLLGAGVYGIVLLVKSSTRSAQPYTGPAISPTTAPGWYPDTADPSILRYFDGQVWTPSAKPRT